MKKANAVDVDPVDEETLAVASSDAAKQLLPLSPGQELDETQKFIQASNASIDECDKNPEGRGEDVNQMIGSNQILPEGSQIRVDNKELNNFQEAINFVNKVNLRFRHDRSVYRVFLDLLVSHRKTMKGKETNACDLLEKVAQLFRDHEDLVEEFMRFLPDNEDGKKFRVAGVSEKYPIPQSCNLLDEELASRPSILQDYSRELKHPYEHEQGLYRREDDKDELDRKVEDSKQGNNNSALSEALEEEQLH